MNWEMLYHPAAPIGLDLVRMAELGDASTPLQGRLGFRTLKSCCRFSLSSPGACPPRSFRIPCRWRRF